MNPNMHHFSQLFSQVPRMVRAHRFIVYAIFILITGLLALGIGRMKVDMTMDSFFQPDEPIKQAYDQFRFVFGSDEKVYLVYEAKDGDVFSDVSLQAVQGIQEELQQIIWRQSSNKNTPLHHMIEVTTLINADYLETSEESLISRSFIGTRLPTTEEEREQLRREAIAHPEYPGLYFSEDFKYGGILIETDFNTELVENLTRMEEASSHEGVTSDEEESYKEEETKYKEETKYREALKHEEEILQDEDWIDMETPSTVVKKSEIAPHNIEFKTTEMKDYYLFMEALYQIINQESYVEALNFYPAGNPVMMGFAFQTMAQEAGMLMLGMMLFIGVALWFLFRSFSAVVWCVVIVALSLIWVMGLVGWSGIPMSQLLEIIVFLVLAIGIADVVHILSGYVFFKRQGKSHEASLSAVYQKSGMACLLTSVTTATGLMVLFWVPIVPVQNFGVFAAFGILFAFVLTLFLLPLLLDLWNPSPKKQTPSADQKFATLPSVTPLLSVTLLLAARLDSTTTSLQKWLCKLEQLGAKSPKGILTIFVLSAIFFGIGAFQIRVDTNWVESIRESAPIRTAYNVVDRFMGGTGNIEILIDSGQSEGMKDPRMLNAIEELQRNLETNFGQQILKTYSLVNVTKESFRALNAGKAEMYLIPQDSKVLIQTLFLFNNADPVERRQLVSDDYRVGRLGISTINLGSQESGELVHAIEAEIQKRFDDIKIFYPDLKVEVTGQIPLMNQLSDYISWSQIKSFGLTLTIISLLFFVVLGSIKLGIIAILPNLFPMIVVFGTIGYLDVPLEMHLMLVVPIAIGIAVDDTIHFLTHYRLEMSEHGNMEQAIQKTSNEVGQAIIFTSVILSLGFLIFLGSSNTGFIHFGLLSALAMVTALLADLFLLPALIRLSSLLR